jgi:hypothetical protein
VSTLHAARFAILFLLFSGIAAAQTSLPSSEPVWSVDFVKPKPGRHDQAMQYLTRKELFDVTNSRVLHDLTAGSAPYFKKID